MKKADLKYFSEFMRKPEVRECLSNYKVQDLYLMLDQSLAGVLTKFLYECKIDAFKYLDTFIPSAFFLDNHKGYTKKVHVKNSIKRIDSYAFELSDLEEITFEDNSQLTKIGGHAFAHTYIKSIGIPRGVAELPTGLFMYCDKLEDIYLPTTIKRIGNNVISGCDNLKNIYYNGLKDEFFEIDLELGWQGTLKDKKYSIICLDGNIQMNKYID
jgi:hypothetical protein